MVFFCWPACGVAYVALWPEFDDWPAYGARDGLGCCSLVRWLLNMPKNKGTVAVHPTFAKQN